MTIRVFAARVFLVLGCCLVSSDAVAQNDSVFEVDAVNPGLPAPPADIDRSTPQSSLEAFNDAVAEEDYLSAAHLLDLSKLSELEQVQLGPRLAERLSIVLDRALVISWRQLLDRPDALDENAPQNAPLAGSSRRSLLLGILDIDDRAVEIRLNRLAPQTGDPVWVFSRQSVENIPKLYEIYGPSWLEAQMHPSLRVKAFWGLRWWEVFTLPIIAAITILIATWVYRSFGVVRARASYTLTQRILRDLKWPASVLAATLFVDLVTGYVFIVSGIVNTILNPLIQLGYVTVGMMLAVSVIDSLLDHISRGDPEEMREPGEADRRSLATTVSALRRIAVFLATMLGLGIVLTSTNFFSTLGFSLVASAGALTLVVGFAAREVLGNILASLQIALNRSARIGDQVVYDGHLCTVEKINFTFVQLKIWTGNRLIVPVSKFVSDEFQNWSLESDDMLRVAELTFAHEVDVSALRSAFEDHVSTVDGIDPKDEAACRVIGQDTTGVLVRFEVPVPNPNDGWDIECGLREAMLEAARKLEQKGARRFLPDLSLLDE